MSVTYVGAQCLEAILPILREKDMWSPELETTWKTALQYLNSRIQAGMAQSRVSVPSKRTDDRTAAIESGNNSSSVVTISIPLEMVEKNSSPSGVTPERPITKLGSAENKPEESNAIVMSEASLPNERSQQEPSATARRTL
ncbi:unnamed protein product [Protopolystoma xenopodis]|uniref:Globin family profile domain-containing protein n=1 Tax=Protopolystoma xenopodis TaxID=117903 RepID=A0A3S5BUW4_9PLAT|nr:unnamed protein product [Protopolystoma xenopodis]